LDRHGIEFQSIKGALGTPLLVSLLYICVLTVTHFHKCWSINTRRV